MKPPRGKRVDPQSRPVEFSACGGSGNRAGDLRTPPSSRLGPTPRALSAGRAPRPVSRRRQARSDAWHDLAVVLRPLAVSRCRDRGTSARFEAARPRWGVRLAGTGQPCLPTAPRCRFGTAGRVLGSVASLSAFHPTRLETRTKESNMRASHWAVRNPKAQ